MVEDGRKRTIVLDVEMLVRIGEAAQGRRRLMFGGLGLEV